MESTLQILLIEDDTLDRKCAVRALADLDAQITEAATLAEARRLLQQRSFHALVVDYHLPDGDGLSLLKTIASTPLRDAAFILITGADNHSLGITAVREGAQDYISKDVMDAPQVLSRSVRYAVERKRTEALRRQLLRAERTNALGQLIGALAHEINNPLSWILGDMEHCLFRLGQIIGRPDRHSAEEIHRELRDMLQGDIESAQRITAATHELLRFSSTRDEEIRLVDLLEVAQIACGAVSNQLRHRATLAWRLGNAPRIAANQSQLVQAATHMLLASLENLGESDRTHHLTIATWHRGEHIGLEITDDGPGFDPKMVEQVFDALFGTFQIQSSGLGLWIADEIIQLHHGQLRIESPPEGGSRLVMVLPTETRLTPTWTAETPNVPSPAPSERIHRVLLIDDEPMLLDSYSRLMRRRGYDVLTVSCGARALELLAERDNFDIIICDLMMPGVDGMEFYQRLEARSPSVLERVIFYTAGTFTDRTEDFAKRVKNPVLRKPLDIDALELLLQSG